MTITKIFVVGSGRSGTTLALRTLECLPDVTTVPRLAGALAPLTSAATLCRRSGILPEQMSRASGEATDLFRRAGLSRDLCQQVGGQIRSEHTNRRKLARFGKRIDAIARIDCCQFVAVKNTAASIMLSTLNDAFPASLFIIVARRPQDVISSLLKVDFWPSLIMYWDGRTPVAYAEQERLSKEVVAARHWTRQVEDMLQGLRGIDDAQWRCVDYDELVKQPEIVVKRVAQWLGGNGSVSSHVLQAANIRPPRKSEVPSEVELAVASECQETWKSLRELISLR